MEKEDNDLEQTKVKKPRSEAQIEAFKKAQQIRKENAVIKKEKIAQIKEQYKGKQPDVEVEVPTPNQRQSQDLRPVIKESIKPKVKKVITKVVEEEEEEEEEEVIIVKKKKPKKKIVYESDSEDDEPKHRPVTRQRQSQDLRQPVHQPVQQQQQRYYPSNHRQGAYGVFAII